MLRMWIVRSAYLLLVLPLHGLAEDVHSSLVVTRREVATTDSNEEIYYRNKLEFSQEIGVLPINIPFVFDLFVGDDYSQKPLHYTMVPVFPSVRWHMGKISGPGILRGNTDLTLSGSITAIPRGPESHYVAFDMGFRRNFVHPALPSKPATCSCASRRSSQPAPWASDIAFSTAVLWSRRIANARRIAQVASSWQSPHGA